MGLSTAGAEPGRVGGSAAGAPAPAPGRARALAHRNFRLFLVTQAVSNVGTQMQNLGQAWLVLVLTGDPFVLGLVAAAQGLPIATLGLVGGVVADRLAKRRILLVTQGTMLLLALALGALCLSRVVEPWHVVVLALALGCANAIDMPARQAFVVEMVGHDDVASAVGLNSAIYNAARLVGPAFAGVVIAGATAALGDGVRGTGVAFVANAASFGSVLAGLALMRERELLMEVRGAAARTLGAIPREIGEGLAFLRSSRSVLLTLLVPGLVALVAVNFNVLVPAYAHESGLDATGLGLMLAAVGVGAMLTALRIGVGGSAGVRVLLAGALGLGAAEIALGATGWPLLWLALLFVAGAGASAMRTSANTRIQLATPAHLRGRVMSLFAIVFEGASPMGGLLAGALASAAGGRAAFAITGAAAILLALAGARALTAREA